MFEDISVKSAYHGNLFGLLMLKTIITNFFEYTLAEGWGGYHGLVFCWTYPTQFRHLDSLEFCEGTCVEEAKVQVDRFKKGMLAGGELYSRK